MGEENERRRCVVVLFGRSGLLLSLENVDAEWADVQLPTGFQNKSEGRREIKKGNRVKGKIEKQIKKINNRLETKTETLRKVQSTL